MDWMLVTVLVLGIPVGLVVWLIARAVSARASIDELSRRLGAMEMELFRLKRSAEQPTTEPVAAEQSAESVSSILEEPAQPEMAPWEQSRPTSPPIDHIPPPPEPTLP